MERTYRVVVAELGPDGHEGGGNVIARALRDAGFEVIDTGQFQTPEQVAESVLQEDADAVGLSVRSGADTTVVPRVTEQLHERGLDDVLVFAGGTVPDDDVAGLGERGVAAVFTPEASIGDVPAWLRGALDEREG